MKNGLVAGLKRGLFAVFLALSGITAVQAQDVSPQTVVVPGRWSEEKANTWYAAQPWLVGANYLPRNAINQLEMWQADTFSPEMIDEELGWAEGIGMNTMRVFLHDIAWRQDPEGFFDRVDRFLAISDKHGIKPMFVLFDDVWYPYPKAGKQPAPRPHLHNSGWVQSPGREFLGNLKKQDELKAYVQAVLRRYANDDRVLAWDLYNEPGNMIEASYGVRGTDEELRDKPKYTMLLLEKTFRWAREVNPSQPLSSGIFWFTAGANAPLVDRGTLAPKRAATLHPINQFVFANSDVINWHNYDHVGSFAAEIEVVKKWNRPMFLTEYLARDHTAAKGTNTFGYMLPVAKASKVAMYNWGLVDGKSQTKYPWDTWDFTWTKPPKIWHHDIFDADGKPYKASETEVLRYLTQSSRP